MPRILVTIRLDVDYASDSIEINTSAEGKVDEELPKAMESAFKQATAAADSTRKRVWTTN